MCSTPSDRRRPATSPATVLLPDRGRPVSHSVNPWCSHQKRNPSALGGAVRRQVGERSQFDALAVERGTHRRVAQDLDLVRALAVVDRPAVVAEPGVAGKLGDSRPAARDDRDQRARR